MKHAYRIGPALLLVLLHALAGAGGRAAAEDRAEAGGEGPDRIACYPLLQYEQLFLPGRPVLSPSTGLLARAAGSEDFLGLFIYSAHLYGEELEFGYPELSHSINALVDAKAGGGRWLGVFKSESDRPVAGGLPTFTVGLAYGFDLVSRPGLSLALGGGLAVGDFGLELPDGRSWPLIPLPLVRLSAEAAWIEAKFEFLTGPNLSLVAAPRSPLRLAAEARMDRFDGIRDLLFDASIAYHPFAGRGEEGDFASLSVGASNSELAFDRSEGSYRLQYYAAYAKLDLSILAASFGYALDARESYEGEGERDPGQGPFFSIQGIIPLGG